LKVATATPTRKPPSRFAASVPSGTVGKTGFETQAQPPAQPGAQRGAGAYRYETEEAHGAP
jgi:hypothetical protein